MRTLFLNPPSFEGFDGGASSRWPASREIESYWYPVWLCYPAGMLPDSKVVDAPPHGISIEQTVEMAKEFELLVLFTSTPGFHVDVDESVDSMDRLRDLADHFLPSHDYEVLSSGVITPIGNKEFVEKLGRDDLCPCGSSRRF